MSEDNSQPQTDGPPQRQMVIQKIYVKDASFESPNAPAIFSSEWKPETSVQLQNAAVALSDTLFEVTLTATITTKLGDKTAYLAEVQQAGLFDIRGMSEAELPRLLGSYCPHTLFPYLRQALDDLISKGGYPEFLLAPVNFEAIFEEQMRQKKQQRFAPQDTTGGEAESPPH